MVPDNGAVETDDALYDRSVRVLTEAGQERLGATTVAVVGVGGLGCILAKQLARLGVNEVVVIDPDHVETSNLNRLLGTTRWDVGRPKVTVLAQQLHGTGLDVTVEAVHDRVEDAAAVLKRCDVVFGTVDQVSTRSFLNQYCVKHLRYYIDAGTVIRTEDDRVTSIEGIVQLVAPGATACYACLDRSDPEHARRERLSDEELQEEVDRGYIPESALAPEPAVVTVNGTIASQAASVFSRLVAGYAAPPDMLRYEELDSAFTELTTRRDPACPMCGTEGMLAHGDHVSGDEELDPADSELDLALGPVGAAADGGDDVARDRTGAAGRRFRGLLHRAAQLPQALTPSVGDGDRGR